MIRAVALVVSLMVPLVAPAQELPRRAWLGAALEGSAEGVRIRGVLPGSSAEAAGLKAGDVVKSLDGKAIPRVADLVAVVRPLRAGHALKAEVVRDGKTVEIAVALKEWPREESNEAYAVEYGDVASSAGRLRTLTFVPKGEGKRPALLLIQGLGAATLDNPRPDEPIDKPQGMGVYRTLADAAARAGMVVVRVDKGGCGDSEGDPARLDFEQELDGYRSALAALKARPDVDGDRVFAFGHSMGGIFAPILATETPLRGVVVYGTVLKTWLEYLAENTRRQVMLAGADPVAFDRMVRGIERFHHAMIVDGKAPSAIFAAEPELAPLKGDLAVEGDTMFGRNYTFFQQLSARNMAEFWTKAAPRTQVLALWGEAEYVSTREDHEWIAALVDRVAPGHGAFAVVTDSEHGFGRADTAADAMKLMHTPGATPEFNPEIVKVLLGWLKEKSAEGS